MLDLTTVVMGPAATQILADLGADVVKVEQPGGDSLRRIGPARHDSMGPMFLQANRNKKSVLLDLKKAEDRETLLELAGEADVLVSQGDFSIKSGAEAAACLFSRAAPPTAVFCFNDEMAMGVIAHARSRGLHVPTDLSVVGFDDIRFAECVDPPLTTIAQPMREIGEGTVALLLEILNGQEDPPLSVTLPHTLQVRGSTARPRTLAP